MTIIDTDSIPKPPPPPAARVGDDHTCPLFDGPKPHVGGPVLPPGAPTVFIEGKPAARVSDKLECKGPPDAIAMGSLTVFIQGRPAARKGDPTAHGGLIVGGAARTFIGVGEVPKPLSAFEQCLMVAASIGAGFVQSAIEKAIGKAMK